MAPGQMTTGQVTTDK